MDDMFEPTCAYEREHDFAPTKESSGLCAVCGLSDGSTSWGRIRVWSYEGMIPGKCNLLVEESMES